MDDFSMLSYPLPVTSTPPTSPPPLKNVSFKKWVEKELRCFSYGSSYYDSEIVEAAQAVVDGKATEEDISDLRNIITWRRKKQSDIYAIADKLALKNIIPASVFSSPIQLLPISNASYKNRKLLIELVPELSRFIVPPEGDTLQIMFFAPLYWLAIMLARAREESPETCCLERVIMAMVDLKVARVPEGKTREGYVRELTKGRELEEETLFLGMDCVTEGLSRTKPFFGWSLAPYDKEFVIEEKKESPVWMQVNDVDGLPDDEQEEESEEDAVGGLELGLEETKKSRFGLKNFLVVMALGISAWVWLDCVIFRI